MANVIRYRLRSDTGENWTSKNPVLLRGEPGFDETAQRFKMGDGVKKWNELPYEKDPDIVNALNSDRTDAALSAKQGKELKRLVEAVPKTEIVDNLTTGGTTKALSAEQGKTLASMIQAATGGGIDIEYCTVQRGLGIGHKLEFEVPNRGRKWLAIIFPWADVRAKFFNHKQGQFDTEEQTSTAIIRVLFEVCWSPGKTVQVHLRDFPDRYARGAEILLVRLE